MYSNFLVTLFANPINHKQRFNVTHKSTRYFIKQTIGQLKGRLLFAVRASGKTRKGFISSCIILNNITKMMNEEDFEGDFEGDFECDHQLQTH